MEAHWATLWEGIADRIPAAPAVVQGERRLSWADLESRAAQLAGAFLDAGLGPGAKVALYLHNSAEYIEAYFATLKVRAVPVNVNYRYLDRELDYLLEDSDAEALVFHRSLGARVASVAARRPFLRLVVVVDDGVGELPPSARSYEALVAGAPPAARIERGRDDRVLLYTGGTTGLPKGVMGRIGGGVEGLLAAVPPSFGFAPVLDPGAVPALAAQLVAEWRQPATVVACPLMHGTGLVIGMHTGLLLGGTVVLLAPGRFDPHEVWRAAERDRARTIVVVGDPFGRPMARALEDADREYDLTDLRYILSSGAMFSEPVRARLLERLPRVTIVDYISSSEGLMGVAVSTAGSIAATGRFTPVPGVKVFDDGGREVAAGSGATGRVSLAVGVPDGYYKDEVKSAETFRTVAGVRYSFPGDWATVEADGSLQLLGRGSQCITTGGEKVYPEEVEEIVKRHPAIEDCLVLGEPDERFGQRVVAVASRGRDGDVTEEQAIAAAGALLADYKVPRRVVFVDTVPRSPSGKADYATARELVARSDGSRPGAPT